jgi:dTDP-4-amino-4,6-dideoxygalactose transaminase
MKSLLYQSTHHQPPYASIVQASGLPLLVAERLTDNTLILPLFQRITESDQCRVLAASVTES